MDGLLDMGKSVSILMKKKYLTIIYPWDIYTDEIYQRDILGGS